jgi:hypothetical protein
VPDAGHAGMGSDRTENNIAVPANSPDRSGSIGHMPHKQTRSRPWNQSFSGRDSFPSGTIVSADMLDALSIQLLVRRPVLQHWPPPFRLYLDYSRDWVVYFQAAK